MKRRALRQYGHARRTRLDELRAALPKGITIETWSPGDGATRYRFFRNAPADQTYDGLAF